MQQQTPDQQTSLALERMKAKVKEDGDERPHKRSGAVGLEAPESTRSAGAQGGAQGGSAGPADSAGDVQPVPEAVPGPGAPSEPSGASGGDLVVSSVPQSGGAALALKTPEWGVGDGWLAEYERMALRVATAVALPEALRCGGDKSASARAVLAIALAGRELSIGFMEATRQIDLINGQTALRSELKMALARRAGLVIDSVEETDISCTIKAHRTDTGEAGVGSFTEADKKQAKLGASDRSAWATYPRDMYYARASARLLRRLCPDFRGASFRSVEEISEEVAGDGY